MLVHSVCVCAYVCVYMYLTCSPSFYLTLPSVNQLPIVKLKRGLYALPPFEV